MSSSSPSCGVNISFSVPPARGKGQPRSDGARRQARTARTRGSRWAHWGPRPGGREWHPRGPRAQGSTCKSYSYQQVDTHTHYQLVWVYLFILETRTTGGAALWVPPKCQFLCSSFLYLHIHILYWCSVLEQLTVLCDANLCCY